MYFSHLTVRGPVLVVPVLCAADELLAKKQHKHLLQDYEARLKAAVDFVIAVRPSITVSHAPLKDPQVSLREGSTS
jgi:phosphopantetheine adenylyltransferase